MARVAPTNDPEPNDAGLRAAALADAPPPAEIGRPVRDDQPIVVRSVSSIIGVSAGAEQPAREDLLERGMSAREANAALVQQAESEVIMGHFMRIITICGCIICLVMTTMVVLWIWLVVTFAEAGEEGEGREKDCDVPLWSWAAVVIALTSLKHIASKLIDRFVCCWWPSSWFSDERPPPRVRCKDIMILIFEFGWVIVLGLYWLSEDGNGGKPACKDVTPNFYLAAKVYIIFNAAASIFFWVSMLGVITLLRLMLRRGMLVTSDAVSPSEMKKALQVVKLTSDELQETPSCPICLGDFAGSSRPIAKVKVCGHIFHQPCLQNWLNAAKSCPLCRKDVTSSL